MDIEIMGEIRRKRPLIHCITNYVTANDVANIILAAGGCAVMADGEREVEDIVSISQGLVINMGTLKEGTIPAIIKAGKRANELGIPVVFDPVGAGASRFRTEACKRVFEQIKVSLARGNASEIKALAKALEENGRPQAPTPEAGRTKGVDVSEKDRLTEENLQKNIIFAEDFAKRHGIMCLMTGNTDIATDGDRTFLAENGTPMMAGITGAGCMLDGLAALFLAAQGHGGDVFTAALAAAAEGYCGQRAEERIREQRRLFPAYPAGTGSFRTFLIDGISCLTDEELKEGMKIEAWKR